MTGALGFDRYRLPSDFALGAGVFDLLSLFLVLSDILAFVYAQVADFGASGFLS